MQKAKILQGGGGAIVTGQPSKWKSNKTKKTLHVTCGDKCYSFINGRVYIFGVETGGYEFERKLWAILTLGC